MVTTICFATSRRSFSCRLERRHVRENNVAPWTMGTSGRFRWVSVGTSSTGRDGALKACTTAVVSPAYRH